MVGVLTSYEIKNDREFRAAVDDAIKKVGDLRAAFMLIANDWFKSNRAQFQLKGSGLYPPLDPVYAARKARMFGGNKPILVLTGRLRDSVTKKSHPDAVLKIGKDFLIMGTTVPYGIYHQSDRPRSKIPLRKFLFIGPESPQAARSIRTGRLERFLSILEAEVKLALED